MPGRQRRELVAFPEDPHDRDAEEQLGQGVVVARSGGGFGVVFGKAEPAVVRGEERIESGHRRGRDPGVLERQGPLPRFEPELIHDPGLGQRRLEGDVEGPEENGDPRRHQLVLGPAQEAGAEDGAESPIAKEQAAFPEFGREPFTGLDAEAGAEGRVPGVDRAARHAGPGRTGRPFRNSSQLGRGAVEGALASRMAMSAIALTTHSKWSGVSE